MRPIIRFVLVIAMLGSTGLIVPTTQAQRNVPVPGQCVQGTLPQGALSLICIPASGWNGDLVVFAHGYIAFNEPIDFQHLTFGDTYLPDLVQRLGFAFATTSYRQNGLAILEGADDIRELVVAFRSTVGSRLRHTFLAGASEGGIIAALLAEQSPELFSGALAMCGPIGNFQRQLDYIADFRALFDYFFPGIIPGSAVTVPDEVIENWESVYVPKVQAALEANPEAAAELIRVSKAAINPTDPTVTTAITTVNLLWYNVFATNDATAKLNGNPYGNRFKWYSGSNDDVKPNRTITRFIADTSARATVKSYETSGRPQIPMVTLHTLGDEIIPYWHESLYRAKVSTSTSEVTMLPIVRYGHCNFKLGSVLFAFAVLVGKVSGTEPNYGGVLDEVSEIAGP